MSLRALGHGQPGSHAHPTSGATLAVFFNHLQPQFPLSRGQRGMDEAPQGRELVRQGSGCRQERESGVGGTDRGGGAAEQAGRGRGSHSGVWLKARPGTPDLAPACPLSQRGGNSGPTTPKRKGQQEDSLLVLMLFSKRLSAELLLQDEVFANQFFPGLSSRPSQPP